MEDNPLKSGVWTIIKQILSIAGNKNYEYWVASSDTPSILNFMKFHSALQTDKANLADTQLGFE